MKKVIIIIVSALLICTIVNAQYKINKTKYNYHTYTYQLGDPYNPTVAGLTSFLLPGLGQMLSGAGGRGLVFLGFDLGFAIVFYVGATTAWANVGNAILYGDEIKNTGETAVWVGAAGMTLVTIWSIVDAVHVAKVNNLAFRDENKTSLNLKIQPYINRTDYNMTNKLVTGISLKITF